MSLSNTQSHYGAVAKTFHWLTALLIVTLIPLGIYANDLPYDTAEELARKAWLFSLHKTLGVTVFIVALARIGWAASQPKPALLHPDRKLESFAAETVHWLLYGSLVLVPLSGWIHHASTAGFAPIWWPFGQNLPLVPKSETLAAVTRGLHITFERVLAVAIFLHLAGALKHHFVDRDVTLRRMLPGTPAVPPVRPAHRSALPVVSALALWVAALVIGGTLGLYEKKEGPTVQAAALEAVQSDWTVEEGVIEIVVRQMGSDVAGRFGDWRAAISFDDSVSSGKAGSVDVAIAIGSLTLGSVTSQALGADFFNAEAFPSAQYTAEILRNDTGYRTEGTLTIKDQSMPVSFPFTLDVTEGVARMTGSTTLDRRNYGIGDGQKDETSLGFSVGVNIALTAREADGG